MADIVTPERRSKMMSLIRGRNTKPEKIVRSVLHGLGYRFRLHTAGLPGSPDIVLPKHRTIILVHGCFWHRHKGCRFCYSPKTRVEFWQKKFAENERRDGRTYIALRKLGWRVITIWECEARDSERLASRLKSKLQN